MMKQDMPDMHDKRPSGAVIQLFKGFSNSYRVAHQFSTSEIGVPKIASIRGVEEEPVEQIQF